MRYPKLHDGDWVQPISRGYKVKCCDCGLIHTMNFRIVDGKIQFQAFRDNKATAQTRERRRQAK